MLGGALEQPVDPPVAGQPMDRDVGLVVQPFALLDVCVGWLRAIKQGKYPVYAGLIVYHLADLFWARWHVTTVNLIPLSPLRKTPIFVRN